MQLLMLTEALFFLALHDLEELRLLSKWLR